MTTSLFPSEGIWAPAACTLPTVERPLRAAEWADLFSSAVTAVRRPEPRHGRLELDPQPDVAARAADLCVRETRCCSFFTFAVTATGGTLGLDITVPLDQLPVLDALLERARAAAEDRR